MNLPVIISAVIVSVIFVLIAVVIVAYVLCVFWRKRDEYRVSNHHSISYSTHSPQLRTDSQSDYSSEFSHGTNITQLGNGSSALSPCTDKAAAGFNGCMNVYNINNPPPSPISTIQMQARHSLALSEDGMSTFSHGFSEYNAPPPPCPSINYDNVSGNMSFSVSQTHFPATINNNPGPGGSSATYHYQYQGGTTGGGGGRSGGRHSNPLHARNPQQAGGGGVGHLYQMRAAQTTAPSHQSTHHYSNSYHRHSCTTHPDITELDSIAQTETESTVSINTENPDIFPYDTSMPRPPPPGRPPSPATVYSEYPVCPTLSPSSSTPSFTSDV